MTEGYSSSIKEYLQRTYFQEYDLTGFHNALNEIYYNIADHSKSDGIAFSYIKYDEEKEKIHVAACDWGLGIPCTLKSSGKKYENDAYALRDSLELGVSAKTTDRNKGFGLDSVVSNLTHGGIIRIVSNHALLFCKENKVNIKVYPLNFDFKGTLIYFEVSIRSFNEIEVLDDVTIG